jgi:hypothetical protein
VFLQILGIIFIIGGLSSPSLSGVLYMLIGLVLFCGGAEGKRDARKKEISRAIEEAVDKRERK